MEREKQKQKDKKQKAESDRYRGRETERQSQRGGREFYTPHWHVSDPQEQNVPHKVERERKNSQYSRLDYPRANGEGKASTSRAAGCGDSQTSWETFASSKLVLEGVSELAQPEVWEGELNPLFMIPAGSLMSLTKF